MLVGSGSTASTTDSAETKEGWVISTSASATEGKASTTGVTSNSVAGSKLLWWISVGSSTRTLSATVSTAGKESLSIWAVDTASALSRLGSFAAGSIFCEPTSSGSSADGSPK